MAHVWLTLARAMKCSVFLFPELFALFYQCKIHFNLAVLVFKEGIDVACVLKYNFEVY